jgi:adenylylsulfate kinase-like enzyme
MLDGDDLRANLYPDLGYAPQDRARNMARMSWLVKLLLPHASVILPTVAPGAEGRTLVRKQYGDAFRLIWVKCDPMICEARDPKGLYLAAKLGNIDTFPGVNVPYDAPEDADLVIDTTSTPISDSIDTLLRYIIGENSRREYY